LPYFLEGNIYPSFTGSSFHVLHIGERQLRHDDKERVNNIFPFPLELVENELNSNWQKLGVEKELYILVRPDNYIALISDSLDKEQIEKYLEKYFIR